MNGSPKEKKTDGKRRSQHCKLPVEWCPVSVVFFPVMFMQCCSGLVTQLQVQSLWEEWMECIFVWRWMYIGSKVKYLLVIHRDKPLVLTSALDSRTDLMRVPQSNEVNFRISPVITTEYLHHNNGWYHCCSFRDTRSWSFHHVLQTILSENSGKTKWMRCGKSIQFCTIISMLYIPTCTDSC